MMTCVVLLFLRLNTSFLKVRSQTLHLDIDMPSITSFTLLYAFDDKNQVFMNSIRSEGENDT